MNKAIKNKLLAHLDRKIKQIEIDAKLEAIEKKDKIRAHIFRNVEKKWWGRDGLTINIGRFG